MPTYPYYCPVCQVEADVIKSMDRCHDEEVCAHGHTMTRRYVPFHISNAGDWKPTYNPAFGQVVRSKAHQREILAKCAGEGRPMVEVGNEPVENIHKACEQQQKETREKRWAEDTEKLRQEVLG